MPISPDDLKNRFTYHAPTDRQAMAYGIIREQAYRLACLINGMAPDCREKSLALTDLDDLVMHTNAAIARHGLAYDQTPPDTDDSSPRPNESYHDWVARLTKGKAETPPQTPPIDPE